jgi:hypothetical protein
MTGHAPGQPLPALVDPDLAAPAPTPPAVSKRRETDRRAANPGQPASVIPPPG